MRRFAVLCLIVACGKSPGTNNGPDANVFGDGPPLSGDKYSLTWGPVNVNPGVEDTQCIWLKLGNDSEIKVHQLHDVLSTSSHHLIVYKDDMDTTEQLTPMPCQPFTGALNTTGKISPIVITQKHDDEITLPDGVAYTFAPHQMVKLEMHYINAGDTAAMAQATVDIFAADPATIHDEAALLFTGSPDIGPYDAQGMASGIAPGATFTLHQFFTVPTYGTFDPTKIKIFAITGHEHKLGTGVQAQLASAKTGPFQNVYDPMPFQWAEPATANFATPLTIPTGGGVDMTCSWTNTGTTTAKFGESATDEMCFFWMYYYPSQGSKVCIHTEQRGFNLNLCCPGDSLCSQVGF
jgi:hypothetical protein